MLVLTSKHIAIAEHQNTGVRGIFTINLCMEMLTYSVNIP